MSEGERFIRDAASEVGLALRAGKEAKPVLTAEKALGKWVSRELRAKEIASVRSSTLFYYDP
jgi:hypothetical protein